MKVDMAFLSKEVRRCNRNLIIASIIMLFISCILMTPVPKHLNSIKYPEILDINKVKSGTYEIGYTSKYFIMKGSEYVIIDNASYISHINMGDVSSKIVSDADYVLVKYEGYWIPVRLFNSTNNYNTTYTAKLSGLMEEHYAEIKKRAISANISEFDPEQIMNIALDTTAGDFWAYALMFISFFLVLIAAVNFIKAVRRHINPYRSPIIRNLAEYMDTPSIIWSIENEVALENHGKEKVFVTESWFFSKRFYTTDIAPISYIAWVYSKSRWRRWKFVIPIYRVTELNIKLKNRTYFTANFRFKSKAAELIEKLQTCKPNLLIGYSREAKNEYDSLIKNNNK